MKQICIMYNSPHVGHIIFIMCVLLSFKLALVSYVRVCKHCPHKLRICIKHLFNRAVPILVQVRIPSRGMIGAVLRLILPGQPPRHMNALPRAVWVKVGVPRCLDVGAPPPPPLHHHETLRIIIVVNKP